MLLGFVFRRGNESFLMPMRNLPLFTWVFTSSGDNVSLNFKYVSR
jgi:hypothetical protein